jgi:hypothetical protein
MATYNPVVLGLLVEAVSAVQQRPVAWTDVLAASATLAAVLVALCVAIFGPRRLTRPRLSVTVNLEPPDCTSSFLPEGRSKSARSGPDHYIVRLRVSNHGNEDARDVEVLMLRLWVINDNGTPVIDRLFLPLLLRWSWWPAPSASAAWLPTLLPGLYKHCDFLVVAQEQGSASANKRWRRRRAVGEPRSWITLQTVIDIGDASGQNPMCKRPGQYQLDFAVAASNAKTIYRTAHISFKGWRDNEMDMFGKGGGLNIELTETRRVR